MRLDTPRMVTPAPAPAPVERVRPMKRLARRVDEFSWVVIGLIAAVATGLGIWGFSAFHDATDSVYHTVALFSFEFPVSVKPNWQLEVARFLAPAAVAAAGAKAAFTLLGDRVDRFRAGRSRSHVVVCGLGRRGLRLVEAFRTQDYRVVAITPETTGPQATAARERGAFVISGDATDPLVLEAVGVDRARCLIVVGPSDERNLEVASQADRFVKGSRTLTVIVHIDDPELCRALSERATWSETADRVSLEFVNVFERGARALLRRFPPFEGRSPDTDAHLLLVGLGQQGASVLVAAGRLWETLTQNDGRRLRVTIVDRAARDSIDRIIVRHPQIGECDIDCVEIEPGSAAFERADFLAARDGRPAVTHAYVCLDDHLRGLSTGLTLLRRLEPRPIPVIVQVPSEAESAGRFLNPGWLLHESPGLHVVGLIEETCTPELLLDTTIETLARAQHENYVRGLLDSGLRSEASAHLGPWDELDDWVREENRAWANDIGHKLDVIDCELRVLDDWGLPLVELDDREVELLAQLEHERWMERRFGLGWRHDGRRDDARRLHPDLVPWESLSRRSKEIDRRSAAYLPVLLARAGFQIRRLAPPPRAGP
jgi:voltage-gated potassium channel Kch